MRVPNQVPGAVTALAFLSVAFVAVPVFALGLRVPWSDLSGIAASPDTGEMLRVSFASSFIATALSMALGVPLAVWIQGRSYASRIAQMFMLLPLVLPPVVAGLALSAALGNRGILAPLLESAGITFAFSFPGVVVAHTFVALPFVVLTLEAALRQLDPEIVASAHSVGLSPAKTLRLVVAPSLAPALLTAAGLAFARSLGEFGTTLTFAGSMPGVTRTVPLGIYLERDINPTQAYGLAAILVGVAVSVIVVVAVPASLFVRRKAPAAVREVGEIDEHALAHLSAPLRQPHAIGVDDHVFPAGHTTALIGPNGCGKSTLAGHIAGRLSGREIALISPDGRKRYVHTIPMHRRGVVLLTQNPALPPASTTLGAVAMVAGRDRAQQLLLAAGLEALADVPVPSLSGGQAAQVALVRALASRPSVLVLDEPLAAIDAQSANRWRKVLRATGRSRTTLLVTHNPLDIAEVCTYTAVLESGSIQSLKPTQQEFAEPSTAFSAYTAGVNWVRGEQQASRRSGLAILESPDATMVGIPADPFYSGAAAATFSPRDAKLLPAPDGSQRNCFECRIQAVSPLPSGLVSVEVLQSARSSIVVLVTRNEVNELGIEPGCAMYVSVDPQRVRIHPLG